MPILRLANNGIYNFYLYPSGRVTASYEKEYPRGFEGPLQIFGSGMLLHGVLGLLSSEPPVDLHISNSKDKWVVNDSNLQIERAHYLFEKAKLDFWVTNA